MENKENNIAYIDAANLYNGARSLNGDGVPKGNCDADLVLRATRDVFETTYDEAIIVSSDGDYASLVAFLIEKNKIHSIVSPSDKCSLLLRKTRVPIVFLRDIAPLVRVRHEKAPNADKTA